MFGVIVDGCPFNLAQAQCVPADSTAAIKCCKRADDGDAIPDTCHDSICTENINPQNFNTPITGSFDGASVTLAQANFECEFRRMRLCDAQHRWRL